MNKKNIIIIAVALFVIIAGSTALYNSLSRDYEETVNQESSVVEPTTELTGQLADSNEEQITVVPSATPEVTTEPEATLALQETVTPMITQAPQSGNDNTVTVTTYPKAPTTTPEITSTPVITTVPMITATPVPTATITLAPTATPVPTEVPVIKNTATNFTVQTYSGSSVSLSSYFGKPIVVNFWASWCGPCKSEMPAFNTVYNEYKNDVVFMMVDLVDGSRETKSSGYNYVTGQGFNFPVYYDVNQDAAYNYSITSVPTTYFIDANGNVANVQKGAMSESKLRGEIEKILN